LSAACGSGGRGIVKTLRQGQKRAVPQKRRGGKKSENDESGPNKGRKRISNSDLGRKKKKRNVKNSQKKCRAFPQGG